MLNPKRKILVTGGAGYIGSHVVYTLCDLGHRITILDNMSLGREENIDQRAKFIKGDILNSRDLDLAFKENFDVVFHFAALKAAGDSMIIPETYAVNNISGTINLLNKALACAIDAFIFSSSAAIYGAPQYLPIDEQHPQNPINYYGYTKLAIEENLSWYSRIKPIKYAALRYFNATGYDVKGRIRGKEKNPGNLSPIVMETAAGIRDKMQVFGNDYNTPDGTCIRDYIHVNDLADAHVLAMEYVLEKKQNLTVNLGTGSGYSVLEVIEKARQVTGRPVTYEITGRRPGDPPDLYADCKLAAKLLNWKAKYSDIETIIKSMCPVYLSDSPPGRG
jgi:UDP-glucose 4-epimerase